MTVVTVAVDADSWVDASHPKANYGTRTSLRADVSPQRVVYAKFAVSGAGSGVSRATLRVYASGAEDGYDVRTVADSSWSERSLTYQNAPARSAAPVGSSPATAVAGWTETDVTSAVTGDGVFSFAVTKGSGRASFASRESGAHAPQLVVETAAPSTSSATATTSTTSAAATTTTTTTTTTTNATTTTTTSAADTTPPSVPSGLAQTASTATSVSLSWQPSSDDRGVTGYDVYVNGAKASATSSTNAVVGSLSCGTSYSFAVDAYDAAGNVSARSASANGATAACAAPAADPVIAAAGDIACDPADSAFNGGSGSGSACMQTATSDLLTGGDLAAVLTLGDNQYEDNAFTKYLQSYDPSWGRVKNLIHPGIGNHEYSTAGAAGYFQYFGSAAGDASRGYYSFDVGAWHVIELNSNCSQVGGCGAGSLQEQWLKADLAGHPAACTLAYWHHPRWSSGQHGSNTSYDAFWKDLYAYGADLVLNGHDHDYERFAPQDPSGVADAARGIREFVVGTGGKSHYGFTSVQPNSELRDSGTYGVLKLTLHPNGYDWRFVHVAGASFADSGSAACH